MLEKFIDKAKIKSPWIYHINTGSCNGCDIELVALLGPKYDIERFGVQFATTPKHADIAVITGPVTSKLKDRMLKVINQIPEPKVVVALGSCPMSCGVFKESYCVEGPLDKWVDVDVFVGGCPPKPEAIMDGILKAVDILKEKRGVIND